MEIDSEIERLYNEERNRLLDPNEIPSCFLNKYIKCTNIKTYGLDPLNEIAVAKFFGFFSNPEVDLSTLPAGRCILDHVLNSCKIEENLCRSNYLRAISSTLNHLNKWRSIKRNSRLHIRTLILGQSNKTDISLFISSLNEHLNFLSEGNLWLPIQNLALNVEYTSGIFNETFSPRLPARISFGSWSDRYDVVVPWNVTKDSDGTEILSLDVLDQLYDVWSKVFSIHGYVTGLNAHEDIRNIESFLRQLGFKNWDGCLKVKCLDLCTILALSGYNAPVEYTALAFIFTGTAFFDFPAHANGYGKYHLKKLPDHLNLCIQSKIIILMNSFLISTITILMHLFPTPSIASLVTKKSFPKFANWFVDFLNRVIQGNLLDPNIFLTKAPRSPKDRILLIDTQKGILSPTQLSDLCPGWSSVSFSGCPTDCLAVVYIIQNIVDLPNSSEFPEFLHLKINKNFLLGVFKNPTGKTSSSDSLGCLHDQSLPTIDLIISSIPVTQELKKYRNSQPELSEIRVLSNKQLLLLFTWTNQELSFLLYAKTIDDPLIKTMFEDCKDDEPSIKFYFPEEMVMLDYLFSFLYISLPDIGSSNQIKNMKQKINLNKEKLRNKRLLESITTSSYAIQKLKGSNKKLKKLTGPTSSPDPLSTEVDLEICVPELSAEELMSCNFF